MNRFAAAAEFKFTGADPVTGEFEGYAAVFGNQDSHGDVITPGAFKESLAAHKAAGTMPAMFTEHGPALGNDPLPSGVWTELAEDTKGLRGAGKISALDTDYGRRLRGLMQDGAMRGLSIGYNVASKDFVRGVKATDPKRTLNRISLAEVSIVRDPSNTFARVDSVKTALREGQLPSLREFESLLRDAGFSRSQAEAIAGQGFKAVSAPRDEVEHAEAKSVMAMLHDFNLPSFTRDAP